MKSSHVFQAFDTVRLSYDFRMSQKHFHDLRGLKDPLMQVVDGGGDGQTLTVELHPLYKNDTSEYHRFAGLRFAVLWPDVSPAEAPKGFILNPDNQTAVTGRKDDSGKLDYTLLDDLADAVEQVVKVMQWAVKDKKPKPYERGSFAAVEPDRYRAAQQRHNASQGKQAKLENKPPRHTRDYETGLLHEAHKATSALMALNAIVKELRAQGEDV